MDLEAFFTLHHNLPREGPGSDEATLEALRRLPPLPPSPSILDLGCGPGRQTLVLARQLQTPIVAVDFHQPFLVRLQQEAAAQGLSDFVITRHANFEVLEDSPETIDLIWAEGSIYILGFAPGLRLWRPLLRDGGFMVVSEATWLTEDPPAEALEFWREAYPTMTTVEENVVRATEAGYEVIDHFLLPQNGWWDEYYNPLIERSTLLRRQPHLTPALVQVLDENEQEIDIYQRYGDTFGYVFYLMRKV